MHILAANCPLTFCPSKGILCLALISLASGAGSSEMQREGTQKECPTRTDRPTDELTLFGQGPNGWRCLHNKAIVWHGQIKREGEKFARRQ